MVDYRAGTSHGFSVGGPGDCNCVAIECRRDYVCIAGELVSELVREADQRVERRAGEENGQGRVDTTVAASRISILCLIVMIIALRQDSVRRGLTLDRFWSIKVINCP